MFSKIDRIHSRNCSQAPPMETVLLDVARTEDSVSSNTSSSSSSRHLFQFKFPLKFHIRPSLIASDDIQSSRFFEAMDCGEKKGLLQDHVITSHVSAASSPVLDHREEPRVIEEDSRIPNNILLQEQGTSQDESQLGNEIRYETKDFNHDDDDDDETDVLKEHQKLVQQMKMELKSSCFRVKGLPTISEDLEPPPKMLEEEEEEEEEDPRRFEFESKFGYKDGISEIRAFHKIYAEKMRRLDVLNYQTLQAMIFREMMDKEAATPRNKKTTGWRPFGRCDRRKVYADMSQRPIPETNRDLELIYVGQLCLSWEILAWSHVKARELLECDTRGNRSYNRAYEEFQRFQVVLRRFVEDEPFQGGERAVRYAKRRCTDRNLLHVPMIKEDNYKERTEEADAISLEALLDVIGESTVVFRDFVYAEKRAVNGLSKGVLGNKHHDKECSDSRFLADVIESLHKKERRMRESIRSQSCMIKKLKKQQRSESEALKSQVELRLVSRVMSLPKLTGDQMMWCRAKLESIVFVGTKKVVRVEPSFSLLPC